MAKHKFQNKSARMISGIAPGKSKVLDSEQAERLRGSAAVRGGEMIELGGEDTPDQAMPKPRMPMITKVKESLALKAIAGETSIKILEAWWKQEQEAKEPRDAIVQAITLRAQSLKNPTP